MANSIKIHSIFILVLLLIIFFGYYDAIKWWYIRCSSADSYYSHAFLIPFVSGFMIWQKKEPIKKNNPELCIVGLYLIIFACILHVFGGIFYVFFISGFSLYLLIIGLSLYLLGKKITTLIIFPLLFLIFMVPLPLALITAISFPLKIIVAKIGTELIQLIGIPVYREGFNMTIPTGTLLIGNPCSGLRSLISFLSLGSIFGYYLPAIKTKKILIFMISVPVAILSNIIRVLLLVLVAYFKGTEFVSPDTLWHDAIGIFVFLVGLLVLLFVKKLLD